MEMIEKMYLYGSHQHPLSSFSSLLQRLFGGLHKTIWLSKNGFDILRLMHETMARGILLRRMQDKIELNGIQLVHWPR